MSGSPKKLAADRQGHGAKTVDVSLRRDEDRPVPIPPTGLLRKTVQKWAAVWESPVASAWDMVADMGLAQRWIRAIDEYERVLPEFRKQRVTTGSTGQLVIHPLAGYLSQLKTEIRQCESELGLTPMARARLGITLGEERLTAMEINRRLNATDQPRPVIEGESRALDDDDEWEQA